MTGTEKKQIYTMLNTLSDWINEYPSPQYQNSTPIFNDDIKSNLLNQDKISNYKDDNSVI